MSSLSFYEIKEGMNLSLWAENEQRSVELPLKLCSLTEAERLEIESRVRLPHIALDVVLKEWKKKLINLIDMDRKLVIWTVDPNNHKQIGHIPVKPVRRAKLDNGKNITGCVFDSRYHGIMQKYIAGRQMERVQRYAANEGIKRFEEHGEWRESIAYQFRLDRSK